jgi:uncharacterized protein YeaO (DUF488 family)
MREAGLAMTMARMAMSPIFIKRVYETASTDDGLRVLVDRLWPRGVSKQTAALDYWAKDAAPSPALRKWFGHRRERFAEFARCYRTELESNPALPELRRFVAQSPATLLFGARDVEINHAVVLAEALRQSFQLMHVTQMLG